MFYWGKNRQGRKLKAMKLLRPINNNIVTALDDNGTEVIVVGKGIGYKAKEGAQIKEPEIQKVYRMDNQKDTDRLKDLFASLPVEYIELTDEIFGYAKRILNKSLYERAYITLADHIHFAVQRHQSGMDFPNALLSEIRRFYPLEYEIGKHALEVVERRIGIKFPLDEAASIAMHILNAEFNISVKGTFDVTHLLNSMLDILEREWGFVIQDGDYYGERFVTHLKFLSQRVVKGDAFTDEDDGLYALLEEKYPKEIDCANMISRHISEDYVFEVSRKEISCLAIHLCRIGKRKTI